MSRTPSPPAETEPVVAVLLGRARELWDGSARRVRAEIPCHGGDEASFERLADACRPQRRTLCSVRGGSQRIRGTPGLVGHAAGVDPGGDGSLRGVAMNRMSGALCSAALVVAVAACDPVGSSGPERHKVVLPEPAPPSAQWIVDAVAPANMRNARCPAPTLSTLAVLDSEGEERAQAFWLVDDVDVCWTIINPRGWTTVGSGTIDDLTVEHPLPPDGTPGLESYAVTAFRGRVEDIRATGDTDRVLGPVHTRAVDLGGGRFVTFVSYGVRNPEMGDALTLNLCPPTGDCRDASIARLVPTTP